MNILRSLFLAALATSAVFAQAPAEPKAKAKKAAERPAQVGPAIGENKATPVSRLKVPPGFAVELIYSVPGVEQGSWVNLCADDRGRIYASDQYGGLYRFTPPAPGQTLERSAVEQMPAQIRAINGMVFAFGALYVGVNDYEQKFQSGVYRVTDSDGDDRLDKVELLRAFQSRGDHGVHAIVPTPDGQALFLISGNNAKPTEFAPTSQVPRHWGEDHLLPRMPDGRGHNRDVLAPGGIIYRFTPDGKTFEAYASGFRNIFDASVNRDGELFTYDADMEYDFNTSWYRPTRINHVTSGGEFGWRNGAGKWPEFYPDNLGAVVNVGPGSPTGTVFGYGAKFPVKYQRALFALDWSWGKLYAVHLTPDGASYTATKEEFISGTPLPLTDAIINPKDGAMYFAIGGRRVQSGVYRVTYRGTESTAPDTEKPAPSPARELRRSLEVFHGKEDPAALAKAWPHLAHSDRHIRWAARIAIEHQPVATWADKALAERNPAIQVEALLALAHATGVCPSHRTAETPPVDTARRAALLAALMKIDHATLDATRRLTHLRTIQIVLNRFGQPDDATVKALIAKLDPLFPAASPEANWLLCETLVYLQAPTVATKAMALIQASPTQEEQIEYARSLRMLKAGWTTATRTAYLEWLLKAVNYRGGASFDKFIEFVRNDALATFTDAEKTALADLIARKPERKSVVENLGDVFAGRTATNWTLDELSAAAKNGLQRRSYERGRKMFGATACFACHRFGNEGGMTGPDLTGAGGRYSAHDLLDQIINPSKEINEQFVPSVLTKNNGETVVGVVTNLQGDTVTITTDPSEPNNLTRVDRKEVKSIEPSKISPMPPMLLNMLTKDEVLDLVAYVLSGGDPKHAMFAR
ncbi:MAG: c-type cytochrome [Opitutaceae bacterium]|nr:c-type cytochrome [Opitutaceae bacterium]